MPFHPATALRYAERMARIAAARTVQDFEHGRELCREWRQMIADPAWQPGIESDLPAIDRVYGPPAGALLLAWEGPELAGCGALKRIDDEWCEIAWVFVRDRFRGRGLARTLSVALMGEARRIGYGAVRFAIPAVFAGGINLYESLGFRPTPPRAGLPPGGVCMEARVRAAARR